MLLLRQRAPGRKTKYLEPMFYNDIIRHVRSAYTFVARPADAGHGHAVLVFDGAGRLHLPLGPLGLR